MTKKSTLPYRLGVKIGVQATGDNPRAVAYTGYIGWATVAMRHGEFDSLPAGLEPDDIGVLVYATPDDMLEPMPAPEFDGRLAQALARLPSGVRVVPVPFDPVAYRAWLDADGGEDTHESRARWAVGQLPPVEG